MIALASVCDPANGGSLVGGDKWALKFHKIWRPSKDAHIAQRFI